MAAASAEDSPGQAERALEASAPHASVSLIKSSLSSLLGMRKVPIDTAEWDGYFDESGHLVKSWDFISANILDRGLDLAVRPEAWKFLTGYYSWRSSQDERLTTESMRRKSYEALCNMYDKIQPLLETEHRGFPQVCSFIIPPQLS